MHISYVHGARDVRVLERAILAENRHSGMSNMKLIKCIMYDLFVCVCVCVCGCGIKAFVL